MAFTRAASKLRAHLEYLKEEGTREIEVSQEKLDAIRQRLSAPRGKAPTPALVSKPAPEPIRQSPPTKREAPPAITAPSVAAPAVALDDAAISEELAKIAAEVAACQKCRLCESRTNTVPGAGSLHPEIMFIGEGPGAEEDKQGIPFVGRAGQLLTQIIEAMGFTREQVFIGNVVKCRPPDNRVPMPDEMAACLPYLERQIALLKPKVIVALGATAVKGLFNDPKISITRIRGQWMSYQGIDTMPTLHPAYLLRNPPAKREVWEDMKAVLTRLGRPIPATKKRT